MKVVICGCRHFNNSAYYGPTLDAIREFGDKYDTKISEIVTGGADGIDKIADDIAKEYGVDRVIFHANWKRHGTKAGPIRNLKMVNYVGKGGGVIAVWDGKSKGTASTIKYAENAHLPTLVKIIN